MVFYIIARRGYNVNTTKGENMKIKVIASTQTKGQGVETKEDYDEFSGRVAGICYMSGSFEDLQNEPIEKTKRRAISTKFSGHHSVFDHEYISLYIEDVPKLFAMILNNEKIYATSEKSARYTIMANCSPIEKELYDKWYEIFIEEISKKYGKNQPFFDEKRIKKLAQENARYFLSVLTPTSMVYSTSFRQLNYLCGWMKSFEESQNPLIKALAPVAEKFIESVKENQLYDETLSKDNKSREFSLFAKRKREECFSENYSINYKGSFASLAQAQRHRTLKYEMTQIVPPEYYVPEIIRKNEYLKNEWLEDMKKVEHLHPQAELVMINERGTPEDFILKTKERLCSCAQLEIMRQTQQTLHRYHKETKNKDIKDMLKDYKRGARCINPDYICKNPCGFLGGITLERDI